ncbi:LysR family transcriptional regulator [Halorubrum sp. CBA1125]|uniref:TOBE domain-containing protein n=1 Tax=Halorubrum sp. CBA1125 TaxID=2668072 RepID=UPI0012E7F05A|nr:TOBE domain-containing protein [Halorubrum sp. CBA1125]MUW15099.1 LysR family transcriptional regulator [Halorubrum sp. CBA1125]
MDVGVEARLHVGDVTFGVADAELLRAIAEHGSVLGASEALGRSRARALNQIEVLETELGPLVERQRGGADGGGSRLTADARTLLNRFERVRTTLSGTANVSEAVLRGEVVAREGEFGLVETDAGTVRALLVDKTPAEDGQETNEGGKRGDTSAGLEVGTRVQVSVRGDTVTLHDPTDAPGGSATSARNRFSGTVTNVDSGESIARVSIDVGAAVPLLALVTHESLDRLALEPGVDVVAAFKSTATRATADEP